MPRAIMAPSTVVGRVMHTSKLNADKSKADRSGRVRVALGEYVGHQSRGGQRRADGAVEDGTFSEHAAADLGSRRGRAVDEVLQRAHGVVIQFRGRAAEQDAPWIDDAGAGDDQPRPRLEHL